MKILIASDSYKGSLGTLQVAEAIKKGVLRVYADAKMQEMAMADGGEGTVEVLVKNLGGNLAYEMVAGPNGKEIAAHYGILPGNCAIIEMAAASGLPLVAEEERDIMRATTYGTGQLILAALDRGCRKIYIGIGGSATNDAGVGMAQALGVSFKDKKNKEVGFGGQSLTDIEGIDISGIDTRIQETEIVVMCDVTNPLCGKNGAAMVYGPQKGASEEQIEVLDQGLFHLSEVIERAGLPGIREIPGAGAAGGLGGGLVAFAGAKMESGITAILEICNFEEKMKWADLIITGEGKLDRQSMNGKVVSGILARAKEKGVPVIAVCGSVEEEARQFFDMGLGGMESTIFRPMDLAEAMENSSAYITDAVERIMRAVKTGQEIEKVLS